MKLYNFQLQTIKEWITLIPTIEVFIDSPIYREKDRALTLDISIFIWHFKWIFIKESEEIDK